MAQPKSKLLQLKAEADKALLSPFQGGVQSIFSPNQPKQFEPLTKPGGMSQEIVPQPAPPIPQAVVPPTVIPKDVPRVVRPGDEVVGKKITVRKGNKVRIIDESLLPNFQAAGFVLDSGVDEAVAPEAIPALPPKVVPVVSGLTQTDRDMLSDIGREMGENLTFLDSPTGFKIMKNGSVVGTLEDLRAGKLSPDKQTDTDGDFFERFKAFGAQAGVDTGVPEAPTDTPADIATREADRVGALRKVIQEKFSRLEATTREEFEGLASGIKAGLGVSEGLNWTSTGAAELTKNSQDLLGQLSDITSREVESLATLDVDSADRVREDLASLREEKRLASESLFARFNDIMDLEIKKQTEERLAKGVESTEENRVRDDARAVLNKILESFAGADIGGLPDEIVEAMNKLEQESGYPIGFAEQGLQTLKELKQEQATEIAEGKLDLDQAKLEQDKLLEEMNLTLRAALGAPRGVTVNIPGLGDITGVKDTTGGAGSSTQVASESQIFEKDTDRLLGFRQRMKDGSTRNVDSAGNPLQISLDPSKIRFVNIGTQSSGSNEPFF